MRIKPAEPLEQIENAFQNPHEDFFGYRELILRLSSMFKNIEHGTVSVINGKWGSGKSTFAKAWVNHLKKSGTPVIYFDSFAADMFESPFEALSGEIIKKAKESKSVSEKTYDKFVSSAARVGRALTTSVATAAVKAATMGALSSTDLKSIGEDLADSLSEQVEENLKEVLKAHSKRSEEFEAFKKHLSELADSLSTDGDPEGLIFVIDELDRCRPDFALEMLEVLKHIFDGPHIHFIIVTNLDQLETSVAHRYGTGAFSAEYLEKFFSFIIQFGVSADESGRRCIRRFIEFHSEQFFGRNSQAGSNLAEYLFDLAAAFNLSLRQVENLLTNAALVFATRREREELDVFVIVYALFMKFKNREMYGRAKSQTLTFGEVRDFLCTGNWVDDDRRDRVLRILQFHFDPDIDDKSDEWTGFHYNYRLGRLSAFPYYISTVIERFEVPQGP